MYKLLKSITGDVTSVFRISDKACIPMNEDNTDYKEYLKWVAQGNTPLPAEE